MQNERTNERTNESAEKEKKGRDGTCEGVAVDE